jgi:hypothetical protein
MGTWRNWNENGRISQFEPGVAAQMAPLFPYPPEIRKTIYTTNAVEALNRSLRKIIKTRSAFPMGLASPLRPLRRFNLAHPKSH